MEKDGAFSGVLLVVKVLEVVRGQFQARFVTHINITKRIIEHLDLFQDQRDRRLRVEPARGQE